MLESKASKFAKGIANAKDKALEGLKTSIVGLLSGTGRLTDSFFTGLNALAELPQGTSTKLHNAAKSIIESVKKTKLSGNAGIIRTGVHAGKAIFGGITTLLIEAINIIDKALLDNAAIDAMAKKFQELNGDTSKLKKWFKEKYRINSYIVYYATILVVAFGLNVGYKSDMLHQIRETVNNKMEKMLEDDDENETPAVDSSNSKDDKNGKDDIIIVVQKGDKLEKIAERYGVSKEYLIEHNGIDNPNKIYVGQKLRIEKSYIENKNKVAENGKEEVKPTNTDKKTTVQKETDPKPGKQVEKQQPKTPANKMSPDDNVIIVQPKDNLDKLAKKYGTTIDELAKVNNLKKPYKIFPGQKLKKPDTIETKVTVNKSAVVKNEIIDLDTIRKSKNKYEYYRAIIQDQRFKGYIYPILADVEGVEPETYYIGDGCATQGIGMTHNYCILPGQEVEDWMFSTETRTKRTDIFAPVVNFMGSIRSYSDLWQQVDIFLLDKGKNPYLTFVDDILGNKTIKSISFNQLAAIIAASFQNRNMSQQILNRLVDKNSPTGLTTDSNKINKAFSTKLGAAQERRNNIEKLAYEKGEVGTETFIVGKDHSRKKQKFSNSKEFIEANKKGGGTNFNETFSRNIITRERRALFKMFYHIIHPNNSHFDITKDDIELITSLKGNFGEQWEEHFKTKKANSNGLKLADYKIQEQVVFYILNNPQEVADNPALIKAMLKKWHAENSQETQQEQDQILLAQANNMRGLGM